MEKFIYSYYYVVIMTTINASQEAHLLIMRQRHKMEEEAAGKIVSISDALDVLLDISNKQEGK
jgi:hypothetical protein